MSKAKILVVIVLYKRKIHQSISFNCIYSELHAQNDIESKIYIYDNSPYPDEEGMILADDNIIYVHDKTNPGVSKAYNQAAHYAELIKCNWILILDQDTFIPKGMLAKYIEATNNNTMLIAPRVINKSSGSLLSPCLFRYKTGHRLRSYVFGKINIKKYSFINSGLMINTSAFFKVGGYNENVYLDYSDHEFISRYKKYYQTCYIIGEGELIQDFSASIQDLNVQVRRFKTLYDCIMGVPKRTIIEVLQYWLVLSKTATVLGVRYKTLLFYKILFRFKSQTL